ncbi:unnamed protein product [Ectocarpus sp. CCAP 1310/34]|nr:unnamed protein product [Ectocarpus sp. CCAP 1310/34]
MHTATPVKVGAWPGNSTHLRARLFAIHGLKKRTTVQASTRIETPGNRPGASPKRFSSLSYRSSYNHKVTARRRRAV